METAKNTRSTNTYHNVKFVESLTFGKLDLSKNATLKEAAFSVFGRERASLAFLTAVRVLAFNVKKDGNPKDSLVLVYTVPTSPDEVKTKTVSITRAEIHAMAEEAAKIEEAKKALDSLAEAYATKYKPVSWPNLAESGSGNRGTSNKESLGL